MLIKSSILTFVSLSQVLDRRRPEMITAWESLKKKKRTVFFVVDDVVYTDLCQVLDRRSQKMTMSWDCLKRKRRRVPIVVDDVVCLTLVSTA